MVLTFYSLACTIDNLSAILSSSNVPQFKDPLIMMLLASAVISVATQQYDDALSITVVSNIDE